jgi:hypothetical protein
MPNRPSLGRPRAGRERGVGKVLSDGVGVSIRGVIRGKGLARCAGGGSKTDGICSKISASVDISIWEKSTASPVAYR